MKALAEKAVFGLIATGLHAAAFTSLPAGGSVSSGAGGAALVSLQGSTPQIAAMVAAWDRPPPVPVAAAPAPAAAPRGDMAPATLPALAPDRPDAATWQAAPLSRPDVALPPRIDRQAALPAALVPAAPQPPQMTAPAEPAATAGARPDAVETAPPPADRPALQPLSADTAPAPAQPAPPPPAPTARPAPAAPEAAPQRAAGSGGSAQAGHGGAAEAATLSAGQRRSLMSTWGAQIRTRIERKKRFPRGVRSGGRVVLTVSVANDGALRAVSVRRSSGNPVLDAAAVQAVRRAGRFPAAPKGLGDPVYVFSLPVSFDR